MVWSSERKKPVKCFFASEFLPLMLGVCAHSSAVLCVTLIYFMTRGCAWVADDLQEKLIVYSSSGSARRADRVQFDI